MTKTHKILIGGHRGRGCTDHAFYGFRNPASLPVENTLESIEEAFRLGADYIECDVVGSADNQLFLIHNTIPADHYFQPDMPGDRLNKLNWNDIAKFGSGRQGLGRPPLLKDVLAKIESLAPSAAPFVINIEIKGTQNSKQPRDGAAFFEELTRVVLESGVPQDRILFSSFSLENLVIASRTLPHARYGFLFDEGMNITSIYTDSDDRFENSYIPFTPATIEETLRVWKQKTGDRVKLSYLHPEVATITKETIQSAQAHGLGINSWSIFEHLDDARIELHREIASLTEHCGVPYTVITDYIPEMRAALGF